jgi:hypothetical protein
MEYTIRRTANPPTMDGAWDSRVWAAAATVDVAHFRPESSAHRPRVQARVLYDDTALYGIYRVEDRYVRCVHEGFQAMVCRDSCVEFFFHPHGGSGYFNFEFNCGGSFLCMYIRDWTRVGDGFADYEQMRAEDGRKVEVWHSLPSRVEPELTEPTLWFLQFRIPYAALEPYTGPLGALSGKTWRGNFYKCGDQTSQPHWVSWAPVDELNFHLPRCFQTLRFG